MRRGGVRIFSVLVVLVALAAVGGGAARAAAVCTLLMETGTGRVLMAEGDCEARVTPASTFKIVLAVMGFDQGHLADADHPRLTIRAGEPAWGGDAWRGPLGPRDWLDHSVVWYSQRLARAIGADELSRLARAYGYGNADFSGDPGQDNGLERAWIASSLVISPREQAQILARLGRGDLPASPAAMSAARSLLPRIEAGGWRIAGKTGSAYPRRADGSFDRNRGWGWFVGWAERDSQNVVFVHLSRDDRRHDTSPGLRARAALLRDWPALAQAAGMAE